MPPRSHDADDSPARTADAAPARTPDAAPARTPDAAPARTPDAAPAEHTTRGSAARVALVGVLACTVYPYVAGSGVLQFGQTQQAHHVLMADALLHGQLHVRPEAIVHKQQRTEAEFRAAAAAQLGLAHDAPLPAGVTRAVEDQAIALTMHDWTIFGNRAYGYWGLLTPVLTMPWVALFGLDASDRLLCALFGVLNAALFACVLERAAGAGLLPMTSGCRLLLAITFALGTNFFWVACNGAVWFSVQVMSMSAMLAALVCACTARPNAASALGAGVGFGLAFLGRSSLLLGGVFFVVMLLVDRGRLRPFSRGAIVRLAVFAAPLAAAMGVQGWYNWARFGDPRDSGVAIQFRTGAHNRFKAPFEQHGMFSIRYLRHNLYYNWLNVEKLRTADGSWSYDPEGNSVLLMTPPLFFAALCWRRPTWLVLAALTGAVPIVVALQFFIGTGWVQFGARYLLDAMPMMLLLAAAGMRGRAGVLSIGLAALGVAVQLYGVARQFPGELGALAAWITPTPLLAGVVLVVVAAMALRRGAGAEDRAASARRSPRRGGGE